MIARLVLARFKKKTCFTIAFGVVFVVRRKFLQSVYLCKETSVNTAMYMNPLFELSLHFVIKTLVLE